MQWVRSLLFTTFLFASAFITGAIITVGLAWWMPFEGCYAVAWRWGRLQINAAKVICGLGYEVTGQENFPPGAHIIMCKHSSAWETLAQMALFPRQAWVLKRELLWVPLVGWAALRLRPIGINRNASPAALRDIIRKGKDRLARGQWIIIFPEGTRVPVGQRHKYGIAGALLAIQAGCQIVPVAHNAGCFWAKRGLLKRPGTIRVVIGPAINPAGRTPRDVTEEVREWIDTTTTALGG